MTEYAQVKNRVIQLFDGLSDQATSPGPLSVPSVITIDGSRGAGKTTLLRDVYEELTSRPEIFSVPIIEPESFGLGDSIYGILAIRLERKLAAENPSILNSAIDLPDYLGGSQPLKATLQRLLRFSHLLGADGESPKSETLELKLSELSRASANSDSINGLWTRVFAHVSREVARARGTKDCKVLVGIDDPDLRPDLLGQLIQQIRFIASIKPAVVAVGIDVNQASIVLRGRFKSEFFFDDNEAKLQAQAHLLKGFPSYTRVKLAPLSAVDRLEFVPLGEAAPLSGILRQVKFGTPVGVRSMEWLLLNSLAASESSLNYVSVLPERPRELVNLYFGLRNIIDNSTQGGETEMAVQAAQLIIETGLSSTRNLPLPSEVADSPLVEFSEQAYGRKIVMRVDLSHVDVLSQAAEGSNEFELGDSGVGIEVTSQRRNIARTSESKALLPPEVLHCVLLAREFGWFADLFEEVIDGGAPSFGGRATKLVNITVEGESADDFFFTPPRWLSYGDSWTFLKSWDNALAAFDDLMLGVRPDPPRFGNWIAYYLLQIVNSTQLSRQPVDIDRENFLFLCSEEGGTDLLALIRTELNTCAKVLDAMDRYTTQGRAGAYVVWLERYMPMVLHPAVVTDDVSDAIMSFRRSAILPYVTGDGNRELRDLVRRRVRAAFGFAWVDGLLEFYERYMPDAQLPQMRALQEQAKRQRAQAKLRAELQDAMPDSVVGSSATVTDELRPPGPVAGSVDPVAAETVIDELLLDAKRPTANPDQI